MNNWAGVCEGDMDLVDGFDTLPEDMQEKVERAIKEKHVDDKDWNGVCIHVFTHESDQASANSPQDLEMNRVDPTGKKGRGMFVKTPKGKKTKVRLVTTVL